MNHESLKHCELCLHSCGVNRFEGEKGFCRAPADPVVHAYHPHHGEEPPLSARHGSGTIFFSLCSMKCVYCQNWQFSQKHDGVETAPWELAEIMLKLQEAGCHNINLVSPTHFVPGIVEAIKLAKENGLKLPIVYNTGGYDSLETIKALEGIVDIYLPDMRYAKDAMAEKYSMAPGYVQNNRACVREMHRQTGVLKVSPGGIASRGVIVRLLILPGSISGTIDALEFIAREIDKGTYLSVMSQYYPASRAQEYKELSHRIISKDYYPVIEKMKELGLDNGWIQPFWGTFDPKFAGENQ